MNDKLKRGCTRGSFLYPSSNLSLVISIVSMGMMVPGYWGRIAVIPALITLSIIAGKGMKFVKSLSQLSMLCIFIIVIQSTGIGTTILYQWHFLKIRYEGVIRAINFILAIYCIGGGTIYFFLSTSIRDMMIAMQKQGISHVVGYVFLSTFQMIGQMKKMSMVIMDAQQARGVETQGNVFVRAKAFIPMLGPLILSSIQATEERTITLESRAFTAPVKKTFLYEPEKTKKDGIIQNIAIAVLILFIALRSFLWLKSKSLV